MNDGPAVLECQDCGTVIRELSKAEEQDMARNPYNWITYCRLCWTARSNG